jgi:hypothetical protein
VDIIVPVLALCALGLVIILAGMLVYLAFDPLGALDLVARFWGNE